MITRNIPLKYYGSFHGSENFTFVPQTTPTSTHLFFLISPFIALFHSPRVVPFGITGKIPNYNNIHFSLSDFLKLFSLLYVNEVQFPERDRQLDPYLISSCFHLLSTGQFFDNFISSVLYHYLVDYSIVISVTFL